MKMKLNMQKPEPPDWKQTRFLEVEEVWPTIQGEGPYAGLPATFIRLSGCNLQCPFCDTIYTRRRVKCMPVDIIEACQTHRNRLVVITGGEPFRQNITGLVRGLLNAQYEVQIETNGTYFLEGFPYINKGVTIVCSPKTAKVHPKIQGYIDAWKYIIDADHIDPEDGLPTSVLGLEVKPARPPVEYQPRPEIYVQPMDESDPEKNKKNMQAAVESVLEKGYRLSIQGHKLAGLK